MNIVDTFTTEKALASFKRLMPPRQRVTKTKKPKNVVKFCCEESSKHALFTFRMYKKRTMGFYAQHDTRSTCSYVRINFCPFCRKDLDKIAVAFNKMLTEPDVAPEVTTTEVPNAITG